MKEGSIDLIARFLKAWYHRHREKHRAARLVFHFKHPKHHHWRTGMQQSLVVGQSVTAIVSPVDANGNPSKAVLSGQAYTSSDPTVFTVALDPNVPGGAIITSVGAGTATLTGTATATEPDGKTAEQIQGVATIVVTPVPPPPPPPAASLVFTFGTPQ